MCWVTKNKPVKQVAKRNIKVQKVLHLTSYGFVSPCFDIYKWKKSLPNTSYLETPEESYKYPYDNYIYPENPIKKKYKINYGLHSCKKIVRNGDGFCTVDDNMNEHYLMMAMANDFICECIIPKGSTYYLNEYGEYVSDTLKFVKIK